MSTIIAIDPGNIESGYAVIDLATRRPLEVGKIPNEELLDRLIDLSIGPGPDFGGPTFSHVAIEMIASYGMAVGKEVFETCVWIGRFQQLLDVYAQDVPCDLVVRKDVKMHHCLTATAKDSNITQALIDRFASGQPNRGKGTKVAPGWFFGFAKDIWQAYALAVLVADRMGSQSGATVK